ncbi:hypothetical protein [Ketogulonicigenium vulgare]|uniref:hypothetical protein n=1 Tax=Ketogulonicigenium vulgare TaxID=92945 RepID=UPI0023585CF4|nr:hypothetical protein [Ketogulonicigenium vulgare]
MDARQLVPDADYEIEYVAAKDPRQPPEPKLKPIAGRMKVADVFDLMALQAGRRGGALALTPTQIAMARTYSALVERHEAGGIKCSSAEAGGGGGGGGSADSFTQARLDASRELDRIRARIGDGVALEVRRRRKVDDKAVTVKSQITDRQLVDAVCLADQSLASLLRSHGWSPDAATRGSLIAALGAALDRMAGPTPWHRHATLRCGVVARSPFAK